MTDIIDARIRQWLGNRRPPQGMTEDQREAQIAEIVATVRQHAPEVDRASWIGQVIEKAMVRQKGFTWPGPDVWAQAVGATAQAMRGEEPARNEPSATERSFAIFVDRINAGQAVAEHDLFNRTADRALREGQINLRRLRSYQRDAYVRRVDTYGPDAARAWVEENCPPLAKELFWGQGHRSQHASDADEPIDGEVSA